MSFNKIFYVFALISISVVIMAFPMIRTLEYDSKSPTPENFEPARQRTKPCPAITPEMFFEAIQNNKIADVCKFLESGVPVDVVINSHDHPFYGFNPLLTAVMFGNEAIVKILLEHGADVDFIINSPGTVNDGLSALLLAVINGNEPIVSLILEYGPEIDYMLENPGFTFHGCNALHIAMFNIATFKNAKNIFRILLEHGADSYATINNPASPDYGFSVLDFFAFFKIREMLDNGSEDKSPEGTLLTVLSPDGSCYMTVTVFQYLQNIQKMFKCPSVCYLIALIYIQRLEGENIFIDKNISLDYKIFLAAMLVAIKSIVDKPFSNKYYARVGWVDVKELNECERNFLNWLQFNVFVSPEDLNKFCGELIEFGKSRVASK